MLTQGDLKFTYTDHGDLLEKENIVTGQKITLTYDQRGQLTRAILNGARTISYGIDGEGHRLTRTVDGVLQTGYLHDVSGRLIAEVEPGGALRSHFVYASQEHSPDYMIRGTHLYYFAKDNLGSVKAVIDASSGAIAQAIHYDEFGRVLVNTNPGFQPFGFAGGHFDHETGLVRFGARDYDPEVGRWTARDPILFNGGQGNLYAYVGNNPSNLVDPSGLKLWYKDAASRAAFEPVIKVLMRSRKGRQVLKQLHDSDKIYYLKATCENDAYQEGDTVSIDPNFNPTIDTNRGQKRASTARIMAHELGHLLGGEDEGTPDSMGNVIEFENPIMLPIEKYKRTRY